MSGSKRGGAGSPAPRPAHRPAPRIARAEVTDGDYAGWWVELRADFPARYLRELQSGDVARIIDVLDVLVVAHNLPNDHDELAATMGDVDPYGGLMIVAGRALEAIGKLPPR